MEEDDRDKSRNFKDELQKYNLMKGKENFKVPQIGGKELDLFKLFKEVTNRGGFGAVCENKQWKEIVNALDLPASCTSASFTLRNHYSKCLQEYEAFQNRSHTGGDFTISTSVIPTTIKETVVTPVPVVSQPSREQEKQMLGKKIIRNEPEYNLIFRYQNKALITNREKTYQKKVRLLNAVPDMRRIVLAFESHITSEIMWALNVLTLFSSNNNCNLIIDSQPFLMESMTNYIYYCVNNISELWPIINVLEGNYEKVKDSNFNDKNILNNNSNNKSRKIRIGENSNTAETFNFLDDINTMLSLSIITKKEKNLDSYQQYKKDNGLEGNYEEVTEYELIEFLISLILIMRNLSLTRTNEVALIKSSKFMNILYLLFIFCNIQEIRNYSLDIITNLSKYISLKELKFPVNILSTLFECLKNSNREISEQALECFRRLTFLSSNEEFFEKLPDEFLLELINLLVSYKADVRESALEIMYCIADQKLPTKTRLGKINKCIPRLIALICSNSTDNRISKLAACTLARLAEVPIILTMIMPYEQDLLLAACTDDTITKIILGIISH